MKILLFNQNLLYIECNDNFQEVLFLFINSCLAETNDLKIFYYLDNLYNIMVYVKTNENINQLYDIIDYEYEILIKHINQKQPFFYKENEH